MAKTLAGALLQKGQASVINQDNLYLIDRWVSGRQRAGWEGSLLSDQPLQFYAVAGGAGGPDLGDLAAETALTVLDQEQRRQLEEDFVFAEFARDYVDRAASVLGRLLEPYFGQLVGTSLSLLVLDKTAAYTVNLGPSQIYLWRSGEIFCLSEPEIATASYRLLGPSAEPVRAEHMTRTALLPGDIFLLATSGLTDVLPMEQLEELLGQPQPFADKARLLGNAVRQAGGRQDLALVVLRVLDPAGHTEPVAKASQRKKSKSARPAMRQSEIWQQEVRQYRWLRPLLIFLLFLLVGALAAKYSLALLGWLVRLRLGG